MADESQKQAATEACVRMLERVHRKGTRQVVGLTTILDSGNPIASFPAIHDAMNASGIIVGIGNLGTADKWYGAAPAPNGLIYGIPYDSTSVLEYDPVNKKIATFGNIAGSAKYTGGVTLPDGNIHCVPRNASQALLINPSNSTAILTGVPWGTQPDKWVGAVLSPNSRVWWIPFDHPSVVRYNPIDDTYTMFGNLGTGGNKWAGGVLAPNGKIYCIPFNATQILEIDPLTGDLTLFGNLPGTAKWACGALGANGMIYCAPFNSTQVLEINPFTRTTRLLPDTYGGSSKWCSLINAPNNRLYAMPRNATAVLEIDPIADKTRVIGNYAGDVKWGCSLIASNGIVVGIPRQAAVIGEFRTPGYGPNGWTTSAIVNKL